MILLIKLYLSFLAIGTMAFGGGYAMLPFVKDVLVNYNHLIMVSQTAYLNKSFNDTWHNIVMTILSGALLFSKKIHPVYIIFIVAILGIIFKFIPLFNL